MTRRRGGLGGLLTALVLALAVVVPGGAAQAAAHSQRSVATGVHAQKAHPSARSQAAHVASSAKIVHHLDATTPPSSTDVSDEHASIVVDQARTGLTGLATPTALGRGPPAS
ncbi:hypothetical protein [Aeromicrobium terrae]|uniref:Uncharacterized protein n=1 Tax=Aeromicrobium terrae TaxID=2498846 RepID=A0A5C8NP87_9ACTN|nr:hypothetical protein [Aeromicrobium terrae]TXL62910.1 hypothetical protein FHP06_01310 [Aeromicrobium terrae]